MKKYLIALLIATAPLSAQAGADPFSVLSIALRVGEWVFYKNQRVYYVQIEATAPTSEQARQEAFRKGVELAVGALVVGESEVNNNRVVRNEIISYSGGYVDDYKIVSEVQVQGGVRLVVDVWVSDSKIANRLKSYGASTSGGKIDGAGIAKDYSRDRAIAETAARRELIGRELMRSVLNDFPRMAFTTQISETKMVNNQLLVTVKTNLAQPYVDSLAEVILQTRDASVASVNNPGVILEQGWFSWTRAGWQDKGTQKMWVNTFVEKPIRMRLSFYNEAGTKTYWNCWPITKFDGKLWGYGSYSNPPYYINYNAFVIATHLTASEDFAVNGANINTERFIRWASNLRSVKAEIVEPSECLAKP